jgi:hypothetical protein
VGTSSSSPVLLSALAGLYVTALSLVLSQALLSQAAVWRLALRAPFLHACLLREKEKTRECQASVRAACCL